MSSAAIRILPRRWVCRTCLQRQQQRFSSDVAAPPLLLKLRGDMKQAMKDKDAARLSVLRGVLAEVTNASKTNNPMKTDIQLLAFLRKRAQASKDASVEFQKANRSDLVDKENAQTAVLEEYAAGVQTMSEEDITAVLQKVVEQLKTPEGIPNAGNILKEVFKQGGPLDGKPVDRSQVASLVKKLTS